MVQFHLPEYKPTHALSDFEFLHDPKDKRSKLGLGSFATVKLAREKKSGKLFALKLIDIHPTKVTKSDIDNLKTEILIHKDLDHPHVIKFYGYIHEENFVYLILDYAENGNLYSYHHRKKTLTEKEIFRFFHQTCLAVSYLHDNDVVHRDIKPENLLLDKDFNIKICDFGWSALDISQERKTFCGTYEYMAPEIVQKKTYDHRVDVWAIGVLLYELMHNKAPFRGRTMQEIKTSLSGGDIVFNNDIPVDAKNLIQKILKNDPKHRMVINEILADPWVVNHLEREDVVRKSVYQDDTQEPNKQQKFKIFDSNKEEVKKKPINIMTDSVQQQFFSAPTHLKKTVSVTTTASNTTTHRPGDISPFNLDKGIITNFAHGIHGDKQSPKSAVLSASRIFEEPKTPPKQGNSKKIFDSGLLSPGFNDRFTRAINTLKGGKKSSFVATTKAKSDNVIFPHTFRVPKTSNLLNADANLENNQENATTSKTKVFGLKGVSSLVIDEEVPKSLGTRNQELLDVRSLKNVSNTRLEDIQGFLSKPNEKLNGERTSDEPKKLMTKIMEDFKFVKNLLVGPSKSGSSSDKENTMESRIGKRNL